VIGAIVVVAIVAVFVARAAPGLADGDLRVVEGARARAAR
jgi:hypothetical protein